MRRVVVTGVGLVSPFGRGVKVNKEKLFAGQSGIKTIDAFDISDYPSKVGGMIPLGKDEGELDFDSVIEPRERKKFDNVVIYGLAAASDAVLDAGLDPKTDEEKNRIGVGIGSGIGGLNTLGQGAITLHEKGPRRVSPFTLPGSLINLISGSVSIRHDFRGPNHAVVTACATGTHAIGDAARMIRHNDADVMLAGGSEAAVVPLAVGGFCAMKALSTNYNDEPWKSSRPWDKGRDGFVMAEGSAVLVLEELEHAKKRGAKIYGEFAGYGLSGDAHHITAPLENGDGGYRAMVAALKDANMDVSEIGYINAHGTSTPLGDLAEYRAVKRLYADVLDKIAMSSTKSMTGHLLGAAGALEVIFSLFALNDGILPPTVNLDDPEDELGDIDLVAHKAKEKKVKAIMSNSFGFGGTNASVIFKEYSE
jgi:3-oxoacyl-[acyl-carrier-protein] synthase II